MNIEKWSIFDMYTMRNNRSFVARRLTAAQQALAVRYIPLARAMAKPLKMAYPGEHHEFDSAALFALVQAAQSFEPSRNVKFPTYARHRIRGALIDVQRKLGVQGWWRDQEKNPCVVALSPTSEDRGRILNSEQDWPIGTELEAIDEVEMLLRKLPSKHAQACRQLYLEDKTQVQAAKALGCSRSRLSGLHHEAMVILGDVLGPRVPSRSPLPLCERNPRCSS